MDHETTEKISNVNMTNLTSNPALAIIEKIDKVTSFLLVVLILRCFVAIVTIADFPKHLDFAKKDLQNDYLLYEEHTLPATVKNNKIRQKTKYPSRLTHLRCNTVPTKDTPRNNLKSYTKTIILSTSN
jgi:hypothetical protein